MTARRITLRLIVLASVLVGTGPVLADDVETHSVQIVAGTDGVAISGRLRENAMVTYMLDGVAGQHLIVSFAATTPEASFSIEVSGSPTPLFRGVGGESAFDLVLPTTGRYDIDVYRVHAAAGRGEHADYRLGIRLVPPG